LNRSQVLQEKINENFIKKKINIFILGIKNNLKLFLIFINLPEDILLLRNFNEKMILSNKKIIDKILF